MQKVSRTAGAVLPLVLTVLLLDLTVLPQMVAVLLLASGTKKILPCLPPLSKTRDFGPERYYRSGAAVVQLWSGTTAQDPRQYRSGAVVKTYIRSSRGSTAAAFTKTATTSSNGLRIQRNQVCWKANDKG